MVNPMIVRGIIEIMTPATGISPRKKTMMANPTICGYPRIIKIMTVKNVLTRAMMNCASITFPNVRENFFPKNSIS